MGKKALFFDVDGTLLDFATHRIPASALDALTRAHAGGNRIFIATGRPRSIVSIPGLTDSGIVDGYVTLNGAVCMAGDTVVGSSPIATEDVHGVARFCSRHSYPCVAMNEEGIFVAGATPEYRQGFEKFLGLKPVPDVAYEALGDSTVYQLTPFVGPAHDPDLLELLPGCELNRWHPAFVDITATGVDKAAGIELLASHYGIDMADTVAFGDGGNDIPMLRRAAIGVAMGNATDDVKAAADMVTTAVDADGIANALAKILRP